ncbi:ABC transporter substrate-binding protein [Metapseudomonas resinovorans]|uniref:Thiamine pyrimidine synthase n=1 Tax=Metapseudomonas resinovorans NBRC 106553 TaxID=1245471 RepID=S6BCR9_METRE|nr:ABC transporter substrate-binding protein [Pseudomonas resinovorans]BAN46844.1 hypothetical protein PCA10_11120 [Pseudomonas resinovorans NBRC 106553]
MIAIAKGIALSALLFACALQAQAADPPARSLNVLLNTSFSGPVAFFLLAEERGYFRDAGVNPRFSPGEGASRVVPLVRDGEYDAGYGDMSSLIERIARSAPGQGPVAVYTTFNSVPFTIVVPSAGPILRPRDLAGLRIWGHPGDSAMLTFDLFARATGLDAGSVTLLEDSTEMGAQVKAMVEGRGPQAMFGFVNTLIATSAHHGVRPEQLRFLTYAEHLPDMYGNTLFVTRELYDGDKAAVRALVLGANRGLAATLADPEVAMDALLKRAPDASREIDRQRLMGTLATEMAHPEGARLGIGAVDEARLRRLIALLVEVKGLPRTPTVEEVFDAGFLPNEKERIKSLARTGL